MRKLVFIGLLLFGHSVKAEVTKTIYNPFTGRPDYIVNMASAGASIGSIGMSIDGGGSAIVSGSTRSITIPYTCVISSWSIVADGVGSIAIDIKKSSWPTYPILVSMVGSGNKPTLSTQQSNGSILSSWDSSAIASSDIVSFVVDSASTVQWATITLWIRKL